MDERELSDQSTEGWPQPPIVYSASADPAAPAGQEPESSALEGPGRRSDRGGGRRGGQRRRRT